MHTEAGHPVFRYDLELPRATTRTLVLHLLEPPSAIPPTVVTQPGAQPMAVRVDAQSCSSTS